MKEFCNMENHQRRKWNRELGEAGERRAAAYLEGRGFGICCRNSQMPLRRNRYHRTGAGERDSVFCGGEDAIRPE